MRRPVAILIIGVALLAGGPLLIGEEISVPAAPQESWAHSARLGLFLSSVVGGRVEGSNDPAIASTTDSMSYLTQFKGELTYDAQPHRVENSLEAKYGRQRDAEADWIENTDSIEYRGAYKHTITRPHYLYGAIGANSVFTGAEPETYAFDPTSGRISAGYGQRHEIEPARERVFDGRVGIRVQKSWGSEFPHGPRDIQTGPETLARYEAKPRPDTSYFVQGEVFSEFADFGHITTLLTAGLSMKVASALTIDASSRIYHESQPERNQIEGIRYGQWSVRQETLIGLTWDF